MKRLDLIKPAVERAASSAGLPRAESRDMPFPVGFDGDAWVWTWREEKQFGIAEVSVVARPEGGITGIEIRVSANAWMPQRRDVATRRSFYARFFEEPPPVDALAAELSTPMKNAWQHALTMADQLPEREKNRTAFLDSLKSRGWLSQ